MSLLLAALSLATLLFAGWGLGSLLFPQTSHFPERAAQAWLLGAVWISVTFALLGLILSGKSLLAAACFVALLPGFAAFRNAAQENRFTWPQPRGWLEWTLCAVILFQCLFLLHAARNTALGWDAMVIWEFKARTAFQNGGSIPAEYFTDAAYAWSHLDYPLMLPMLETWVYMWIGQTSQLFARIIFPFFYLAALALIYSGVAAMSGRRWVGLLTAAILFFIPYLTVDEFNLFTGYADFPLAVFYLAAGVCLIRYTRDPLDSHALSFAIYAGALPWMKHEGTLLWLCIVPFALAEFLRRRKVRLALIAVAPGLAAIGAWKLAMASLKTLPDPDFLPVTFENIAKNAGRAGYIAHSLIHELFWIKHWSLLWFLFPIALVMIAAGGRRYLSLQLGAAVFIPLVLYSSVYLLSQVQPYEMHVATSLPRLISQLSLVALLSIGIALPVPPHGPKSVAQCSRVTPGHRASVAV